MSALFLLAASGYSVVARDPGPGVHPSLRGARVGGSLSSSLAEASRNNGGGKDEPPTLKEMALNATEGKSFKFVEELLNMAGYMPPEEHCNNFFMHWEVEGHEGGKEQGLCEINDLIMPFVALLMFAVQFTLWFALCRKRRRSVKGPYAQNDTSYIQAVGFPNSPLLYEMLWWWFLCCENFAGPRQTVKGILNIFESLCCFCWMHADTMTRAGISTNLNAYGNGCLMCVFPGPCCPCFWGSAWLRRGTRIQILQTIDKKHEPSFMDFLLHCLCCPFTIRQEAELVEMNRNFENGQPPVQQGMQQKGAVKGAGKGPAALARQASAGPPPGGGALPRQDTAGPAGAKGKPAGKKGKGKG